MKERLKLCAVFRGLGLLKIGCGFAFFMFLHLYALNAQQEPTAEYRNKATFLINLSRFVYWPDAAFDSKDEPLIIGIVGKDPFGQHLDGLAKGEKTNHRTITIKRFKDLTELQKSHILYFNIDEPSQIKEILAKTDPLYTLTVSDHNNFVECGGGIVFFKEDNKIRIGINTDATKKSSFEISSKLMSISKDMANNKAL